MTFRSRLGRLFDIGARKASYMGIGPDALLDLAEFCRANESCYHSDPRDHARMEGRREVWLRVRDHLHLTEAQLVMLYQGQPIQLRQERNL